METQSDYRERLGNISSALFRIHKLLLEDEFETRERNEGRSLPPTERLNVLLNDPSIAWLRTLSQLMAFVDEVYYQKEAILDRQMEEALEKVQAIFSLQNESEFTYRYKSRLGTIPDLMVAHGQLRSALKGKSAN